MSAPELAYIQARMFRQSGLRRFDSKDFITRFMNRAARFLDDPACEPEKGARVCNGFLHKYRNTYGSNIMWQHDGLFWMGYLYRIWHDRSGIPSPKLCEIADPEWVYFQVYRNMEIPRLGPCACSIA